MGSIIDEVEGKFYNIKESNRSTVTSINQMARNFNKRDGVDYSWDIGCDPSTSCSGFILSRQDRKIHFVFDYERKETSKEIYIQDLGFIFSNLCMMLRITNLVIEQPLKHTGNHAMYVLSSLAGDIRKFIQGVPELEDVHIEKVRVNSWKSFMHDESKGTGRYNDKYEMATDICDKYPAFRKHFYNCKTKDYDSMDAIGVLYFFLDSIHNDQGEKLNYTTPELTHYSRVYGMYVEDLKHITTLLPAGPRDRLGLDILKWNPDYSFYENIKMASTRDKIVVICLDDLKHHIRTCWEFGIDYQVDKTLVLYIVREKSLRGNDKLQFSSRGFKSFMVY